MIVVAEPGRAVAFWFTIECRSRSIVGLIVVDVVLFFCIFQLEVRVQVDGVKGEKVRECGRDQLEEGLDSEPARASQTFRYGSCYVGWSIVIGIDHERVRVWIVAEIWNQSVDLHWAFEGCVGIKKRDLSIILALTQIVNV